MAANLGVELVSLDELFARSDFITIHTPKTKDTAKLLNKEAFKKMKPGVRLINCARGGLIDEAALLAALKEGKVAGAALDVYETEPPSADWPLRQLPNVVCTPHLGASTEEAQANVAVAVCEQILELLLYGTIKNAVNAPSVSQEAMVKLKPYPDPGRGPGGLSGPDQRRRHHFGEHRLCRRSLQAGHQAPDPFLLKGMLYPVVGDEVNYVNAPAMAAARGIHISEEKVDVTEDFSTLIRLTVQAGNEENWWPAPSSGNTSRAWCGSTSSAWRSLPKDTCCSSTTPTAPGSSAPSAAPSANTRSIFPG